MPILKTAVAMLVLDQLAAGGSYTEFYAMDLAAGFVLMGHDGPGHLAISNRRPILRGLGLYLGKAGQGLSLVDAAVPDAGLHAFTPPRLSLVRRPLLY